MNAASAEVAIVEALNRFADLVNAGDAAGALSCFTADPSIVEDLAPYHWRGAQAGAAWLAAMADNAERRGISGIHMRFLAPTMVEASEGRAYAVLPGDLTYSFPAGPDRGVRGLATFTLLTEGADWKVETLTWAWERELS